MSQNNRLTFRIVAVAACMTVVALLGVIWADLRGDLAAKADEGDVEVIKEQIEDIECDVDYLKRKAEVDVVNETVTRRVLDDIARRVGANPGGDLAQPRPAELTE